MTFAISHTVINSISGATFADLAWGRASPKDEIDFMYDQIAQEREAVQFERAMREMDADYSYDVDA